MYKCILVVYSVQEYTVHYKNTIYTTRIQYTLQEYTVHYKNTIYTTRIQYTLQYTLYLPADQYNVSREGVDYIKRNVEGGRGGGSVETRQGLGVLCCDARLRLFMYLAFRGDGLQSL